MIWQGNLGDGRHGIGLVGMAMPEESDDRYKNHLHISLMMYILGGSIRHDEVSSSRRMENIRTNPILDSDVACFNWVAFFSRPVYPRQTNRVPGASCLDIQVTPGSNSQLEQETHVRESPALQAAPSRKIIIPRRGYQI